MHEGAMEKFVRSGKQAMPGPSQGDDAKHKPQGETGKERKCRWQGVALAVGLVIVEQRFS